jgi:hypothetical protein
MYKMGTEKKPDCVKAEILDFVEHASYKRREISRRLTERGVSMVI